MTDRRPIRQLSRDVSIGDCFKHRLPLHGPIDIQYTFNDFSVSNDVGIVMRGAAARRVGCCGNRICLFAYTPSVLLNGCIRTSDSTGTCRTTVRRSPLPRGSTNRACAVAMHADAARFQLSVAELLIRLGKNASRRRSCSLLSADRWTCRLEHRVSLAIAQVHGRRADHPKTPASVTGRGTESRATARVRCAASDLRSVSSLKRSDCRPRVVQLSVERNVLPCYKQPEIPRYASEGVAVTCPLQRQRATYSESQASRINWKTVENRLGHQ